jgi:uncharacterized protein (TIGR00251 family)
MATLAPQPFSPRADGVSLTVRLTPKAGRERIDGIRATPDGVGLAVAVKAPPEDGKANAALIALLAKALHLPKSAVHLTHGGKSRNKTVTIDGAPEELMSKLTALVKETARHG